MPHENLPPADINYSLICRLHAQGATLSPFQQGSQPKGREGSPIANGQKPSDDFQKPLEGP